MTRARFKWNRHLYDIGAVDVETGKVMECHTEKQLAEWDYHRDFVFSYEQSSAMNTGKSLEFQTDPFGEIVLDPFDVEEFGLEKEVERLTARVLEQIKIVK